MQFRVLGPLEVSLGGRPVELGRPKQRAVLGVLLIEANRVVPLDRLIDLLWGEEPPPTANGALQVYVSGLRRVLEPERLRRSPAQVLVTSTPGYVLRVGEDQLDANRFETLAALGQRLMDEGEPGAAREALVEALSLWRGPAYADFTFEPFAQAELGRLEELRAAALEERISADMRLGNHIGLVAELESLVAEHPLRERLWSQLILALYRSERQSDALRAFTRARVILLEELGIEPGPVLRRLHEDVLRQSSNLEWRPPADMPQTLAGDPLTTSRFSPRPLAIPGGIVGRNRELRVLRAALTSARTGRGGLVLISGEPGIGKTRLVEELVGWATGSGLRVAWGRCLEGEGAPSYWPWVQVIRSLLRSTEAATLRASLGPNGGEIAQIAPEIKEFVTGLDPPAALDAAGARFRMYEAVADFLAGLAVIRPVVVVLEDLHWADLPSLRLIEQAAGRLRDTGILLLGTYRDVDPPITGPLAETLGALARQPSLQRLPLVGLSPSEVGLFMALTAGSRPTPGVTSTVHARTDGNPFFVAELARLLAIEDALGADELASGHVPVGVRDVIRRRLCRLPAGTIELLELASVIGRDVDLRLVATAGESEEDDASSLLDASVSVGLLVESPATLGTYKFAHALIQETIYGELGPARRARLHARAAEAVRELWGLDDGHAAGLAHHLYQATPVLGPKPAYDQALLAAEVAERRLAFEEAEWHLRRALDLVQGMPPGAKRSYRELAVHHRLAALLSVTEGCHTAAVNAAWTRAEALSRELGDVPQVLTAVWGLARLTRNRGQFDVSHEFADQLLLSARRSDDPTFAVAGHESKGLAAFFTGDFTTAVEHLTATITLSDDVRFAATAVNVVLHPGVSARGYLACALAIQGHPEQGEALIDEGLSLARTTGRPLNEANIVLCAALLAMLRGDAPGVHAWTEEIRRLSEVAPVGPLAAVNAIIRSWAEARQGDPDRAEVIFARSMAGLQASGWRLGWTCYLFLRADAHRVAGRYDQALLAIEQGFTSAENTGEHFYDAELCRLKGEILASEVGVDNADAEGCLRRAVAIAAAQGAVAFRRAAEASLERLRAGSWGPGL